MAYSTAAEVNSDGLMDLGFVAISVKQMSDARRTAAKVKTTVNFPLPHDLTYDVKVPGDIRTDEHIAIRVKAYKSQTSLIQRYNCQNFGHAWG
jgi:hypothetical protein